ncbi:MAG: TraR/DksA C4-type zinc finger protein [Legionellales bacterium]
MLTEDKLRKMPASEYMNKEQLEFFEHRLLELQTETEKHIEVVRQQLAQYEFEPDDNDRASLEEERATMLRIIERETKLLPKILYSLKQIKDGTYGYCEETGEPIGIERLLLRPTATLSTEAKSLSEAKERHYSDLDREGG